jgi:hypothetical protein
MRWLLRPLLTSAPARHCTFFRAQGLTSPGKNALLHQAAAGFLATAAWSKGLRGRLPARPFGTTSLPVPVHRPAGSIHASSPRSVGPPQLRFSLLAVASLRWDLRPQECAMLGAQTKNPRAPRGFLFLGPGRSAGGPRMSYASTASKSSATILVILIAGLTAGPAVSL